jgi:large subunit ribosomal protein L30
MPRKKVEKHKTIVVTWKHSTIGRNPIQRATIAALGFKHLNQSLSKPDVPAIRGMIKTVEHLVEVKEEA